MKSKKLISILTLIAIVFGLLAFPCTALAEDYDIWVEDKRINSDNAKDVFDNGTVIYDVDNNVLILKGAKLENKNVPRAEQPDPDYSESAAIYSKQNITIEVKGENVITINESNQSRVQGLLLSGGATIKGDGILKIEGGSTQPYTQGIDAGTSLTIKDKVTVNVNIEGGYDSPSAIHANLNINIEDNANLTSACSPYSGKAFTQKPNLSNHETAEIKVGNKTDGSDAQTWDESTDLRYYKYVEIVAQLPPDPNLDTPVDPPVVPPSPENPIILDSWNLYAEANIPKKVETVDEFVEIAFTVDSEVYRVDDENIKMDGFVFIKDDRIMLPVRYVAEALGMEVSFDNATRIATFKDANRVITINIDTGIMQINGEDYPLDVKPEIINDRIYLPLGLIADALGMSRENPA
ncbi:MAG: copper amine oxidase N-terminal domain-containing protein, partial [Tissierellia bacterium]|nr:copper amine oxidase N-terminal domain-containing protein [Tissierellia bacterium]